MQSSAFLQKITEDEILERAIFRFCRNAARNVALVDVFRLPTARIAKAHWPEIRDFELHRYSAAPGIILQHVTDEAQVIGKRCRKLADTHLLHPTVQHLFLKRN